jgi:fructose-1-phosphate kinase PfkB-like protein
MAAAKNKEENNPEQKNLIKFIKPNQEELKSILEKITEEISIEKD